jgi:hypothetical protein
MVELKNPANLRSYPVASIASNLGIPILDPASVCSDTLIVSLQFLLHALISIVSVVMCLSVLNLY